MKARTNGLESHVLIREVRKQLQSRADPAKAGPMQAYMKSTMPYLGVQTPALRALCRDVFARLVLDQASIWRDTVLALWRGARFREERYAALELTGQRRYRAFQDLQTLPMYEEMITTGAWWDYVDAIAAHRIGYLLGQYPAPIKKTMRVWAKSPDLWKRRSAILCQLRFKKHTDLKFLHDCIEPSITSSEFFLRKAIGWALREYAKTDARAVKRYVRSRERELSPLSKREALKNLVGVGG